MVVKQSCKRTGAAHPSDTGGGNWYGGPWSCRMCLHVVWDTSNAVVCWAVLWCPMSCCAGFMVGKKAEAGGIAKDG